MATLVTGGAGFVGINIVEELLKRGEDVVVFGKKDFPPGAAADFLKLSGTAKVVLGDVRDRAALDAVFTEHAITRLFHGAVITAGGDRESRDVHTILDVNLQGTVTVLEAGRDHGIGRIVYPSSNSVYGESLYQAERVYEEGTPALPVSVYAITKYAGERLSLRLGDLWGLDLVCARIGSVFGPWEHDTGVRDLLSAHLQLAQMALRGEQAILPRRILPRPWVYSRDVAAGIVGLLDAARPRHRVYNVAFGSPWGDRILDWCDVLAEAFPSFSWRLATDEGEVNIRFHETRPRCPESIERFAGELGYRARFGPAEAYSDYLAWITAHPGATE